MGRKSGWLPELVDIYLNFIEGEVVPIGKIEEFKMTKRAEGKWIVWVTSRTGAFGRDQHKFIVPHDQLSKWFEDMLNTEEGQ